MTGEVPTVGLRRGPVLCLSGRGLRAVAFHLGALTRLNELGLLAGVDTVRAVGGGSIVAALLTARVPWPLHGAFRDWPEEIAAPTREIARGRLGARLALRGRRGGGEAALEERYARELVGPAGTGTDGLRLVIGGAGLVLGGMEIGEADDRATVRWELEGGTRGGVQRGLAALAEEELAALEDAGYLVADAVLRKRRPAALEPLPPEPPHSRRRSAHTRWRAPGGSVRRRLRPPLVQRPWRLGTAEAAALLERLRPVIQYDSLESYRADSVATIAEFSAGGRCNALHRADGTTLASAHPNEGAARLGLRYLGESTYADGRRVERDDYLDEAGGSHAADALAARRREGCADVVYGRSLRSGGWLWLQYWFFHYYNDKGFLNAGRHEGDWEMVQVRVGRDGTPNAVSCAQHAGGERAEWRHVERRWTPEGEAPLLYCARGSHAPRLRPGTHLAPIVPDHNDGLGVRIRPRLVPIGDDGPAWVGWPGRWGSTRRREAFECDSPRGPAEHSQWAAPDELHGEARPLGEAPPWRAAAPPRPRLVARREGDVAVLSYRFPDRRGGGAEPARIVAATAGRDVADGVVVNTFGVEGRGGSCALPIHGGAPPRWIRASVSSELGAPGETIAVPIGQ